MEQNNNQPVVNPTVQPVAPAAPAPVAPVAPVVDQPVQPVVAPVTTPVVPETQQIAQQITQPAQPTFELPTGVSDRTTAEFGKLTESNRRLLEANQILEQELSRRNRAESQFAPIQTPVAPQQPDVKEFLSVDPITGEQYIDENKLQASLDRANSRAIQAEQQVKNYIETQQRKEIDQQEREAYQAFPQLNPNDISRFDPELNKLTRAYALDSMMNPSDYGNRTLSFKEAADLAQKKLKGAQPIAAPSTEAQQVSAQANMDQAANANQISQPMQPTSSNVQEQGGVAAEGGPVNVNPASLSDDSLILQDRTRRGDIWALAKRLTQVPHTGTPTHGEGD